MQELPLDIETTPKKVLITLCVVISTLLSLNILGIVSKFGFGHDQVKGLVALFDLDVESNIPTFYSAFMLMVASILLGVITYASKRVGEAWIAWGGLSLIFMFLAFDEIASIHERFIEPMQSLMDATGFLRYAWVVPYGIAVVIITGLYSGFLLRLPRRTMKLFLLSGAIYVSGALGFELLGGKYASLYGTQDLSFALICTVEETLEMVGVAVFIYSMLTYMVERFSGFRISVGNKG